MRAKKIKMVLDQDNWPRCPYCDREVQEMHYRRYSVSWRRENRWICFCPHCYRILQIDPSI